MYKYRVRAVAPDVYIVEKHRWYGLWTNCMITFNGYDFVRAEFSDPRKAQDAFHELQNRKYKVKQHCAQEPWYFE